ncbi:MAG: hypothetical protein AAF519_19485 [Bacteroidota bacterium]
MKRLLVLGIGFCTIIASYAQESTFSYRDRSDEMEIEVPDYASKHYLGEAFTEKFYAVREKYLWKPLPTATSPNPSFVTEKPSIYNSLRKLDRFYKKQLKKGNASPEEVKKNLEKAVAVCYSVRYEETEAWEKVLWKTKDITEIEKIFTERVVLN